MEKKTPLYETHLALEGKVVPFAGYLLPIQYKGIIEEHLAVRQTVGIFDVSHMGEVLLEGAAATQMLEHLCPNTFADMKPGKVRYSQLLYDTGGAVDDILVYKFNDNKYWVIVNASNRHKDVNWMKDHKCADVQMTDISDTIAQIALQGPNATAILERLGLADGNSIPAKYYTFIDNVNIDGIPCLISQTGYTGSMGYELYCANEHAERLWAALSKAGAEFGLQPCGLGARDTLRLEAGMPLYGHELDELISPLETGLGFSVKMQKEDFIGKAALIKRGEPTITRVGLKAIGRGIMREDCPVFADDGQIGKTTSGTYLPYLKEACAMALIKKEFSTPGTVLTVEVRGKKMQAEVVALPFYQK